ncbi:MAG: hypothetical protein HY826_02465 [Actinobacteria bacterium]|nr:hypothetical protein [Actinomycetota bacterium]
MYTLGAILLLAVLLGAVVAVIDSVLDVAKLKDVVAKIPVIGAHWGLGISILMIWLLDLAPAAGWGVWMKDDWMNIVANGAIVYGAIPLKDAVVSMVNKGLRA